VSGPLAGRAGIVTGAGRGIGRAIAERLVADGARVAVLDLEPGPPLDGAHAIVADVRDPAAVEAAVAEARERLGGLHFLVNNAGIRHYAPLAEHTDQQWRDTLDINVTGTFLCTRAALADLEAAEGGGRVVNLGSIVGRMGAPNRVAYCTSKAAVEGMTRALAVELGPAGVRVNAIAPAVTETPMARRYAGDAEAMAMIERGTPARRMAQPEEVAGAAAFLVGPDAGFVNGVTLYVDGGWAAGKEV
jgi:2-hydroxycyclohexanecarboxyl-CoA dehydrogenase